jgi:hypothetical protein
VTSLTSGGKCSLVYPRPRLVASCGATLLLVCRTALALVRPSVAERHPSLVNTLSEVGFLSSVQILLQPSTSNTSTNLAQHLLRVMYIATAAAWVEKTLSGNCTGKRA